jgi:hypothetical protein
MFTADTISLQITDYADDTHKRLAGAPGYPDIP